MSTAAPTLCFGKMQVPSNYNGDDKTSKISIDGKILGEITGFRDRRPLHPSWIGYGYRKVVEYHVEMTIDGWFYHQSFYVDDYPNARAALAAAKAYVIDALDRP